MRTGMTGARATNGAIIALAGVATPGNRVARIGDRIGDGRIVEAEARSAARRFGVDADGDATGEMRAASGGRIAARAAKRFESPGANGDGALARAGLDATAGDRLTPPEADGNGTVTRDELQGFFRRGG